MWKRKQKRKRWKRYIYGGSGSGSGSGSGNAYKYAASASGLFKSCYSNFGRYLLTRKIFSSVFAQYSSKFFLFIENNIGKYHLTNYKTNLQIEKQNWKDLEAEALPQAITFCWKWKRRKRKRKRLGWKRKQKR
jgi:hypothetical protein